MLNLAVLAIKDLAVFVRPLIYAVFSHGIARSQINFVASPFFFKDSSHSAHFGGRKVSFALRPVDRVSTNIISFDVSACTASFMSLPSISERKRSCRFSSPKQGLNFVAALLSMAGFGINTGKVKEED